MKAFEGELRKKWESINYHDGGSLQLAIEHPLEWFVRYETRDNKSLVIVTENPAERIESSKSIEAACNLRKDGKYAVSFTLINRDQDDVFIAMSSDIIEFSRIEKQPKESLKRVLQRYAAWMKLLDHKRNALLSLNSQKGLLAELLFLRETIENGMKPSEALAGWGGPDGSDQDFVYEDGWHEIKATGVSSTQITISSVEQLDNPDNGELVVFRIDKCSPAFSNAITLYAMVHILFEIMKTETGTLEDFIMKLATAGYIDMIEYDKQYFQFSSKQCYHITDSFPRIKRSNLPTEIVNIEYQLSLPSLGHWCK